MKTQELKEKLHNYIETADGKKLKAIYTMVEEEIEETNNRWEDEIFVAEIERREKEYLNGTAKTYTFKETLAGVDEVIEKVKAKK
jgi:hypothetical protein